MRAHRLRAFLERSRDHKNYCERQLSEFVKSADMTDPQQKRCWQKLRSDLQLAESDVSWLQKQLDDLMD